MIKNSLDHSWRVFSGASKCQPNKYFFAKMQLLNLLLKYHFQEIFVDSLLYINFVFLCNVVLHIVVPKFTCNLVYIFKRRPYRANNYILCFIEKWWQNLFPWKNIFATPLNTYTYKNDVNVIKYFVFCRNKSIVD